MLCFQTADHETNRLIWKFEPPSDIRAEGRVNALYHSNMASAAFYILCASKLNDHTYDENSSLKSRRYLPNYCRVSSPNSRTAIGHLP